MDSMVVDLPLSILYAAVDAVREGFCVKLLDLRLHPQNWRETLSRELEGGVRLIGISVMTGAPLKNAREITRLVRQAHPSVKIVWGGPHVTVVPETMQTEDIDFMIRGYGSLPFASLLDALRQPNPEFVSIKGLTYRGEAGSIVSNDRSREHEMITHRDIPYHLLDVTDSRYSRSYNGTRMFPIFTAIGCPYKCTFCIHPRVYRVINGKKWNAYPPGEVVDHIDYLINRFGARHICVLDDTSFPDLKRMEDVFEEILKRRLDITLEFRGARINELDRMDDRFRCCH